MRLSTPYASSYSTPYYIIVDGLILAYPTLTCCWAVTSPGPRWREGVARWNECSHTPPHPRQLLRLSVPVVAIAAGNIQPRRRPACALSLVQMLNLLDSASFLASVLASGALQFFSRTIRVRPWIHKIAKAFDRGQAKVGFGAVVIDDPALEH